MLLSNYDTLVTKVLAEAESISFDLKHNTVGTDHLLLAILQEKESKLRIILEKYHLTYDILKEEIISSYGKITTFSPYLEYTTYLSQLLQNALILGRKKSEIKISLNTLSIALLEMKNIKTIDLLTILKVPIKKVINELKKVNES